MKTLEGLPSDNSGAHGGKLSVPLLYTLTMEKTAFSFRLGLALICAGGLLALILFATAGAGILLRGESLIVWLPLAAGLCLCSVRALSLALTAGALKGAERIFGISLEAYFLSHIFMHRRFTGRDLSLDLFSEADCCVIAGDSLHILFKQRLSPSYTKRLIRRSPNLHRLPFFIIPLRSTQDARFVYRFLTMEGRALPPVFVPHAEAAACLDRFLQSPEPPPPSLPEPGAAD